jgi:hypothetical protein
MKHWNDEIVKDGTLKDGAGWKKHGIMKDWKDGRTKRIWKTGIMEK